MKRVLYHDEGAGTVASPVTISFTFVRPADAPSIEELRALLPATVEAEESETGVGYKLKGKNPRMTRMQLQNAWNTLVSRNSWNARHEG